jgi:hypothetical protein
VRHDHDRRFRLIECLLQRPHVALSVSSRTA